MATVTEVEKLTFTIREAAKMLGVSRGLAYQLAREDKIPVIRLGKRLVVPKLALEQVLAGASHSRADGADNERPFTE